MQCLQAAEDGNLHVTASPGEGGSTGPLQHRAVRLSWLIAPQFQELFSSHPYTTETANDFSGTHAFETLIEFLVSVSIVYQASMCGLIGLQHFYMKDHR